MDAGDRRRAGTQWHRDAEGDWPSSALYMRRVEKRRQWGMMERLCLTGQYTPLRQEEKGPGIGKKGKGWGSYEGDIEARAENNNNTHTIRITLLRLVSVAWFRGERYVAEMNVCSERVMMSLSSSQVQGFRKRRRETFLISEMITSAWPRPLNTL